MTQIAKGPAISNSNQPSRGVIPSEAISNNSNSHDSAEQMKPRKVVKGLWDGVRELSLCVSPHRKVLALGIVALLIGSAINLYLPQVLRSLLNDSKAIMGLTASSFVVVKLGVLVVLQGICFYFRSYLFGVLGLKTVRDLRQRVYESILTQRVEFFDSERTGDLVSRISADTATIQDLLSLRLSVIIRYSIQVIVGLILMLAISWQLTLMVGAIVPVLVLTSRSLGSKLRRLSKAQQQALADSSSAAEEAISNIRLVKAMNASVSELKHFKHKVGTVLDLGIKRQRLAAFYSSFVSMLMNLSLLAIGLYGISLTLKGMLPVGDLTAFLLYGLIVAISFAFLASSFTEIYQSIGATDRVWSLMDAERPEEDVIKQVPASYSVPEQVNLELRQVRFAYPIRPEGAVLKGIDLKIPFGRRLAVVGRSGAGKSTIFQLLLGLYSPTAGSILINNMESTSFSLSELRSLFGFAPQEPYFFNSSIKENLRYANHNAPLQQLEDALKAVGLYDFVQGLPYGIETLIGERGIQLSGGQRQRLSLARVLVQDPKVLLLDEPTSSLDSESEDSIQTALESAMKGRTTLVIAHRLSTIMDMDEIIVIDDGIVSQSGNHDTLAKEPGLYKTLLELQLLTRSSTEFSVS